MDTLIYGMTWYAVLLFSLTLHEASHALAALLLGDKTAYHSGQVTLDPIPHIQRERIGMVVIPLVSFVLTKFSWMMGWASIPYDPHWAWRYPRRAAYMALAGPLANLFLMLLAIAAVHAGIHFDMFYQPQKINFSSIVGVNPGGLGPALGTIVSILFSLNLILFIFNLFPLPPLDGSCLYTLVVSEKKAQRIMEFMHQPGLGIIGLLVAWQLFPYVIKPIQILVLNNILYPGAQYH